MHAAFARDVWRSLLRLGVDDAALDDAVQEVFVTAFRRWDRIRDRAQRRAWLLGIARRIAFRHRRGDARRARRVAAVEPWAPPSPDPEHHAATVEAGVRLQEFLDALDDDKRAAFVLGELEELDREALGAALGVNPNTAYSRLAAARRRFVAHFAPTDTAVAAMAAAMGDRERAPSPARTWAALVAALPSGGAVAATPQAAPPPHTAWWTTTKLVIGLGAAVALGAIALDASTRRSVPPPPQSTRSESPARNESSRAPAVAPAELTAEAPTGSTIAPPERDAVAQPRPTRAVEAEPTIADDDDASAVTAPDGVDGEVAVLHAARRALGRGDVAAARQWLALHRRRWPDGGAMSTIRESIERQMIKSPSGGDDRP